MIWKKYWIGAISKLPNAFGIKTEEELEQLPPTIDYNINGESNQELKYVRSDLIDEQLQALQYEVDLLRVVVNVLVERFNNLRDAGDFRYGESGTDIVKKFLGQSKPL